ncbi:MAG: hypothetical protein ACR2P4_05800 [Gammaproteobacteria bacterium]
MSTNRHRPIPPAVSALMEEAEDREWANEARRAKKEGFITAAESAALMRRLRQNHVIAAKAEIHRRD